MFVAIIAKARKNLRTESKGTLDQLSERVEECHAKAVEMDDVASKAAMASKGGGFVTFFFNIWFLYKKIFYLFCFATKTFVVQLYKKMTSLDIMGSDIQGLKKNGRETKPL